MVPEIVLALEEIYEWFLLLFKKGGCRIVRWYTELVLSDILLQCYKRLLMEEKTLVY